MGAFSDLDHKITEDSSLIKTKNKLQVLSS